MNQITLKVNRELLDEFAKKKFIKMTNDESLWEKNYKKISKSLDPKCIFAVCKNPNIVDNTLIIENTSIVSEAFSTIPKEILEDISIFVMTIGDFELETLSILDNTLIDIMGTAYVDALKDMLRLELEENFLVGGLMAPGIEKMALREILKFDELLNFKQIDIKLNESFTMIPEKSSTGLFMLFKEAHPTTTNSCDTCMSRGCGCNFCHANGEIDV